MYFVQLATEPAWCGALLCFCTHVHVNPSTHVHVYACLSMGIWVGKASVDGAPVAVSQGKEVLAVIESVDSN